MSCSNFYIKTMFVRISKIYIIENWIFSENLDLYCNIFTQFIFLLALDVMETAGETGALQPKYLREAVRRLRTRGRMPIGKCQKPYFRLN